MDVITAQLMIQVCNIKLLIYKIGWLLGVAAMGFTLQFRYVVYLIILMMTFIALLGSTCFRYCMFVPFPGLRLSFAVETEQPQLMQE